MVLRSLRPALRTCQHIRLAPYGILSRVLRRDMTNIRFMSAETAGAAQLSSREPASWNMVRAYATELTALGGAILVIFSAGMAYGHLTASYKEQIKLLENQLEYEKKMLMQQLENEQALSIERDRKLDLFVQHEQKLREKEDQLLSRKLDNERDQVALTLAVTRSDFQVQIAEARYELLRYLWDASLHSDYEKWREHLDKVCDEKKMENLFRSEVQLAAQHFAHVQTRQHGVEDDISIWVTSESKSVRTQIKINPYRQTIGDLKYIIEDRTMLRPSQMRFFFKGMLLEDDKVVTMYKSINSGSTLHLEYDDSVVGLDCVAITEPVVQSSPDAMADESKEIDERTTGVAPSRSRGTIPSRRY